MKSSSPFPFYTLFLSLSARSTSSTRKSVEYSCGIMLTVCLLNTVSQSPFGTIKLISSNPGLRRAIFKARVESEPVFADLWKQACVNRDPTHPANPEQDHKVFGHLMTDKFATSWGKHLSDDCSMARQLFSNASVCSKALFQIKTTDQKVMQGWDYNDSPWIWFNLWEVSKTKVRDSRGIIK